jgi:hypothetical protein
MEFRVGRFRHVQSLNISELQKCAEKLWKTARCFRCNRKSNHIKCREPKSRWPLAFECQRNARQDGNYTVAKITMNSCGDQDNGGAIYLNRSRPVNIMWCDFINCTAKMKGGAVYLCGPENLITRSKFWNCTSQVGACACFTFYVGYPGGSLVQRARSIDNSLSRAESTDGGALDFSGTQKSMKHDNATECQACVEAVCRTPGSRGPTSPEFLQLRLRGNKGETALFYWRSRDNMTSACLSMLNNSVEELIGVSSTVHRCPRVRKARESRSSGRASGSGEGGTNGERSGAEADDRPVRAPRDRAP